MNRAAEDAVSPYDHLVRKAVTFGMKIWSAVKLESVLERCLVPSTSTASTSLQAEPGLPTSIAPAASHKRSLVRLLQSERIHGTTERDPTQKRHDFRYFSRSSYFVLVEDMQQELATIAALEYTIARGRDGSVKNAWPVLHCHPRARGPFIEYDEREKKRWEKTQRAETEKQDERERKKAKMQEEIKRRAQVHMYAKRAGDLRRSVSMNNLHRRATHPDAGFIVDLDADGDHPDSANASGYLASTGTGGAYMAASGNSVGITSTTGTTSTAGNTLRNLQLPAALRGRIQQQVVTSRKFPLGSAADKAQGHYRAGAMGPPVDIPERPTMLKKSRSTNTLRLDKREEGSKPGYCESCRTKFDNFKVVSSSGCFNSVIGIDSDLRNMQHIIGRKHRKFAADDANFLQLDFVLARVQRRTLEEVEAENRNREARRGQRCSSTDYSDQGGDERTPHREDFSQSPQNQCTPKEMWDVDLDADGDVLLNL